MLFNIYVDQSKNMFCLSYSCYYSNGTETGNQGVGLLIETSLNNV